MGTMARKRSGPRRASGVRGTRCTNVGPRTTRRDRNTDEGRETLTSILRIIGLLGQVQDKAVFRAVELAEQACQQRTAEAARRAIDAWQVACWIHSGAERIAAAVGFSVADGGVG